MILPLSGLFSDPRNKSFHAIVIATFGLMMMSLLPLWIIGVLSSRHSRDDFSPNSAAPRTFSQILQTPYYGQHVGVKLADLNGDGAMDILVAAGRHWIDQSYVLLNLGPLYLVDGGDFQGIRFSDPLPIGPPAGYYQIDVLQSDRSVEASEQSNLRGQGNTSEATHKSQILLVGATCHHDDVNDFGACTPDENTPARILNVSIEGCSMHHPDIPCQLKWTQDWVHPSPYGDRNGGFVDFELGDHSFALLGQGGIEVWGKAYREYSLRYQLKPPPQTDPRSDVSRYSGFGTGSLGSRSKAVLAAGRRTDWDVPQRDEEGNVVGINFLVHQQQNNGSSLLSTALPPTKSGEVYEGNPLLSIQSTGFAFADLNGDGIDDLLEATFLETPQIVDGYPFPQRAHILNGDGIITGTILLHQDPEGGRSVTSGQIYSDSPLPDVVFANAQGIVTVFSNLGVDDDGIFLGFEQRHQFSTGHKGCQVRDVAVTKMADNLTPEKTCWVGIVGAVACQELHELGQNEIFYIEGKGQVCESGEDVDQRSTRDGANDDFESSS